MIDRTLGGGLHEHLARSRAEGKSWEQIARQLFEDHGIEVSQHTLWRWAKALGIEVGAA